MMKKTLALALAFMLLITGCGSNTKSPKVKKQDQALAQTLPADQTALNVQIGGEPARLDPAFADTTETRTYLAHLLEGLTMLDDKLQPVPAAATAWEVSANSSGNPIYTFKLDTSSIWADGVQVKADDFIFSWTRTLDPATNSPVAYELYPIKNAYAYSTGQKVVVTVNGQEVEQEPELGLAVTPEGWLQVTLENSCPDFLSRLATPVWAPLRRDIVAGSPNSWNLTAGNFVSNGPYTLREWNHDQNILMQKNLSYWNASAVAAEKINFILSDNTQAITAGVKTGSVHLAVNVDAESRNKVPANTTLRTDQIASVYTLVLRTDGALSKNVREALAVSVDREALLKVLQNHGAAASGLVPDCSYTAGQPFRSGGESAVPAQNTARAKELLAAEGYSAASPLSVTFLLNDSPMHQAVAQELARQWKPLGINLNIQAVDWNTFGERLSAGSYDMTRLTIFASTPDPACFLEGFTSNRKNNYAHYSNDAFDRYLVESGAAVPGYSGTASSRYLPRNSGFQEDQSRLTSLKNAEHLLTAEDIAVIPLFYYQTASLQNNNLSGAVYYGMDYWYFGNARLAPSQSRRR